MKPFRATYKPREYSHDSGNFTGYNDGKAEIVLVVSIQSYDRETNPDIIFIHGDGKLDCDTLPCFTQCQWND